MFHRTLFWVALSCLPGCVVTGPTLDTITATALARTPMRHLQTDAIDMYYPAGEKSAAMTLATRLETCLQRLRKYVPEDAVPDRASVILHRGEQNNAYVMPGAAGQRQHMVLPLHESLEFFNLLNLGLVEVDEISCHEALHYVVFQQTYGFWSVFNSIFGPLTAPATFFDSWFHEGMATYYEARLAGEVGRPDSLLWRGMFNAGVAGVKGELHGGHLSVNDRELSAFGGNYLIGMHFVEYLAQHYDPDKLWEVVDMQANSIFSPLGLSLRVKAVYGLSLGALFDEFVQHLKDHLPNRMRPVNQVAAVTDLGYFARMTGCPAHNLLAVVHEAVDEVPRLSVWQADGTPVWSRRLVDILPGREHIVADAKLTSGLSFDRDCSHLFLVTSDIDADTAYDTALWQLDARDGTTQNSWPQVKGIGGGVDPSGQTYAYVALRSNEAFLTQLNLASGTTRELKRPAEVRSMGAPVYSPDGTRLAYVGHTESGYNIYVTDVDGVSRALTHDDNFNYSPQWLDSDNLLVLRGAGERLQAFKLHIASGALTAVTDVPYALLDPVPLSDNRVALLNAEGWGWSLDVVTPDAAHKPPTLVADAPTAPTPLALVTPVERIDEPYSGWDQLFVPTLRIPTTFGVRSDHSWYLGAEVAGRDQLERHNYAITVLYDSGLKIPSFGVFYTNTQLAPWYASLALQQVVGNPAMVRAASASIGRSIYTSSVQFNLTALDRIGNYALSSAVQEVRAWGPGASWGYAAGEYTPYGGTRRGLSLGASVQTLPSVLGNTLGFTDLSGQITGYIGLGRRHQLSAYLAGQAIVGTDASLLQTGGVYASAASCIPGCGGSSDNPFGIDNFIHSNFGLQIAVPGYEDLYVDTNRYAKVGATWTYPIIIDHGWLSLLYLFPSIFISELDFTAFGSGAVMHPSPSRALRAVGGNVTLYFSMLGTPMSLAYQAAYRWDDAAHVLQLMMFSL